MINTRFAPSPTGNLHIGNIRTALFSWAYSKHYNGSFFLRIEDTDIKREIPNVINNIIISLKKLKINFHGKLYFQKKNLNFYQKIAEQIIKQKNAYYCYLPKKKKNNNNNKKKINFLKLKPVIRFKNPFIGNIIWKDLVKGIIKINNKELNNLIILRSNNIPTYNFCTVIDDINMKITHIIRGDEHINNTAKQINIFNILRSKIPKFVHLPMILNINGKKFSKRLKAPGIIDYLNKGFLYKAILNYLIKLSWSYYNKEIFSVKKFYSLFKFKNISKSPARIDINKLIWLNKFYLKKIKINKLFNIINSYLVRNKIKKINNIILLKFINIFKNRINILKDLEIKIIFFFKKRKKNNFFYIKKNKNKINSSIKFFYLEIINIKYNKYNFLKIIKKIVEIFKIKLFIFYNTLRYILLGYLNTPSIISILEIFNKKIIILNIKKFLIKKNIY